MLSAQKHFQVLFDRNVPPAIKVSPGAEVTFETIDACSGEVRTVAQFKDHCTRPRPGNPMTGPVFIEGAKPGMTLTVDILKIDLAADGFQLIGPNRAVVRDEITEWTCYAFQVKGDKLYFPNGVVLPAKPIIGQFGNAPAGEPTNCPNILGGNIDCPFVRVGARLHIPVEVDGALFCLGDVHACQGDGEVVGAPEIGGQVTVKFGLLPHRQAEGFLIEDADDIHSCRTAENEGEAARLAVFQNARFLAKEYNADLRDTLILLTHIGRLSIARTAKWGAHNPVVCSSYNKAAAKAAMKNYHRLDTVDAPRKGAN